MFLIETDLLPSYLSCYMHLPTTGGGTITMHNRGGTITMHNTGRDHQSPCRDGNMADQAASDEATAGSRITTTRHESESHATRQRSMAGRTLSKARSDRSLPLVLLSTCLTSWLPVAVVS
jgi:hypothetical protein